MTGVNESETISIQLAKGSLPTLCNFPLGGGVRGERGGGEGVKGVKGVGVGWGGGGGA